jgi:hypothetical protein
LWIRAGRSDRAKRNLIFVRVGIHLDRHADLTKVAQAFGLVGSFPRFAQRRQQHGDEDCDDSDDDQELDKRKSRC